MIESTPEHCAACGTSLLGRWCYACGQDTEIGQQSLLEVVEEGVEEVTMLDSKGLRTIKALALHPGRLLVAYRAGASSRYVTPLKLFVVMTALFLITVSMGNIALYQATWVVIDPEAPVVVEFPEGQLVNLTNTASGASWLEPRREPSVDPQVYVALREAAANAPTARNRAAANAVLSTSQGDERVSDRLADWLPNVLWMLAPLHALLLAPFFGRKRRLTEHLAFSFWAYAMAFGCMIILFGLKGLFPWLWVDWFIVPYLIYFTLAARQFYDQSWLGAGIKAVAHTALYFIFILTPAFIISALTAFDWGAILALRNS